MAEEICCPLVARYPYDTFSVRQVENLALSDGNCNAKLGPPVSAAWKLNTCKVPVQVCGDILEGVSAISLLLVLVYYEPAIGQGCI